MVLIDGVVRQVFEEVLEVRLGGRLIQLGAEPCKALFTYVSVQRVHASNTDVYSQVKLVAAKQKGLVNVSLNHHVVQHTLGQIG